MSSVTALPEVDLRPVPANCGAPPRGAHEVGFFYLTGHDVPETLSPGCSRWRAAVRAAAGRQGRRRDGAQPAFPRLHPAGRRADPGEVDWREQIDIGRNVRRSAARQAGLPVAAGPQPVAGRAAGAAGIIAEWDAALPGWRARCCGTGRRRWAVRPDVFDAAFAEAPATLIKVSALSRRDAASLAGRGRAPGLRGADAAASARGWPRCRCCPTSATRGGTDNLAPTEDPADPIFSVYGRNAWKSRLRPLLTRSSPCSTGSASRPSPPSTIHV